MINEKETDEYLAKRSAYRDHKNSISENLGLGSVSSPISDSLYGLNNTGEPAQIPMNKEQYGLLFFTKPRLNLSIDNIKHSRIMYELSTGRKDSFRNYIRCNLDPRVAYDDELRTSLVDVNQAFIPILTNMIISCTGWPDLAPEMFTTAEGLKKESMSWVDGVSKDYTTYDIQASFRNVTGDPVTDIFFYWVHYMSLTMESVLEPYGNFLIQNELDHNTAIYRLVLDENRTFVRRISRTIATPTSSPIGAANNFERETPYNQSNDQIAITFRAHGMETQDPILIHEFNRSTWLTNPSLQTGKESLFFKVPRKALRLFKNRCYPQINPMTRELEWWVSQDMITQYMSMADWHASAAEDERLSELNRSLTGRR